MVIGVANAGGYIPPTWFGALLEALEAGLDLISGMHVRLATLPGLQSAADKYNRRLIDVRTPPAGIPVASGLKRSGRRLLTVGTDCALGKKYTALAIARGLQARGIDATFRATGQTGIMIAGEGMPIDSVVADFIAGAAEMLSPNAPPDHIDVIEGQGSLFHPSYAGVALGLLHGSQPDRFVVCHEPGRTHVLGHAAFPLPSIEQVIEQTIALGRLTNPGIRCAGVSLNTAKLDEAEACANSTASKSGWRCRSRIPCGAAQLSSACSMPVSSGADQANQPSAFQRFVLPGLAFKAVVIGGGYATGREIAEFFLPAGPWGGIAAMAVATVIWCVVCATTFIFARRLRERDYRSFFRALLGRAWPVFEICLPAVRGADPRGVRGRRGRDRSGNVRRTADRRHAVPDGRNRHLSRLSETRASNASSRGSPYCSTAFTPRSWSSP